MFSPLMLNCTPDHWRIFIATGRTYDAALPPELQRSWQESMEAGVLPDSLYPPPPVLTRARFEALLREHQNLLHAARGCLELLGAALRGTRYFLMLSDNNGHTLKIFGDELAKSIARDNALVEGCNLSTRFAGTNSVNVCLAERKTVLVKDFAHYCSFYHNWTGASSPIMDDAGGIAGVFSVSGPRQSHQPQFLDMATAGAEMIADNFKEAGRSAETQEKVASLTRVLNAAEEGIVALDPSLFITFANTKALRLLKCAQGDVLQQNILDIIRPDEAFRENLKTCQNTEQLTTTFRLPKGRQQVVCRVCPLGAEERDGTLLTFSKKQEYLHTILPSRLQGAKHSFADILGESDAVGQALRLARIAARGADRILLMGESGTGKELFAQAIHNASGRNHAPFVAVSCPALPADLVESELFGYEYGAFTGARRGDALENLNLPTGAPCFWTT